MVHMIKPVSVSKENGLSIIELERFFNIKDAEDYIAKIQEIDPDGVYNGLYSIDYPEHWN